MNLLRLEIRNYLQKIFFPNENVFIVFVEVGSTNSDIL